MIVRAVKPICKGEEVALDNHYDNDDYFVCFGHQDENKNVLTLLLTNHWM